MSANTRAARYVGACAAAALVTLTGANAQELEIHYINVGQGGSTLIVGPDGTKILYDFGNVGGDRDIVPYLKSIGIMPGDPIDYTIVSHRDQDHYYGFRDVIDAGYDVTVANFDSGSTKNTTTIRRQWLTPARRTTAEAVQPIPVGLRIPLGDGAEAVVLAANGRVLGGVTIPVSNENDRSVSVLVKYKGFHYIIDGDLGAGREPCSRLDTTQVDVQTPAASAAIREGHLDADHGVDVLHVAHHGSESSTSAAYLKLVLPEVAVISVGIDQSGTFKHPRQDVVEGLLIGNAAGDRAACAESPPVRAVFQTEDGLAGSSSTGRTSNVGLSVGDIVIKTDGDRYVVTGSNRVHCREIDGTQLCSDAEAPADGMLGEFDVDDAGD
jgi:beta-lactamase superfamily II metal-dependent hydrolase